MVCKMMGDIACRLLEFLFIMGIRSNRSVWFFANSLHVVPPPYYVVFIWVIISDTCTVLTLIDASNANIFLSLLLIPPA